ncbi:unnamed protein product, partial [Urochloa humidicola]
AHLLRWFAPVRPPERLKGGSHHLLPCFDVGSVASVFFSEFSVVSIFFSGDTSGFFCSLPPGQLYSRNNSPGFFCCSVHRRCLDLVDLSLLLKAPIKNSTGRWRWTTRLYLVAAHQGSVEDFAT